MKHPNDWHLLPRDAVFHALESDLYRGLTEQEVRRRRRRCGHNAIWQIPRTAAGAVARAAIFDLATILLMISAATAALFEKSTEAGALVGILLLGALLRSVTYIRANRILEDAAREKIPTATVLREGILQFIPAEAIVPGDILLLEAGDTVPCDARVVAGEDAIVSERGITENKSPVHKFETTIETANAGAEIPCEFRSNMLFAGSLVLSGSLRAAATACGEAALIVRKQGGIVLEAPDQLPMVEKLRTRAKTTSLVMLACVMLLTALSLFLGKNTSLADVFLGTMSMAVAAMSEFVTIIGTIMVAVAVRDAARPTGPTVDASTSPQETRVRAIIRRPEHLDKLADVRRVVFCGTSFFKSGRTTLYAYCVDGKAAHMTKEAAIAPLLSLAQAAVAETQTGMASGMTEHRASGSTETVRNALTSYIDGAGVPFAAIPILDHRSSADPQTRGMELSMIERDGKAVVVAVGAIEDVLRCCTTEQTADAAHPLTDERRREIFTECARLTYAGAKMVAVATRPSPYVQLSRLSLLTGEMCFVGYLAVAEEPEVETKSHIAALRRMGIAPILFTDTPENDLYYCHRLGLFNKHTARVTADEVLADAISEITEAGLLVSFAEVPLTRRASVMAAVMKKLRTVGADDAEDTLSGMRNAPSHGGKTAAIGREVRDSGVLASADVGFAASRNSRHSVPETLSRHADVLLRRDVPTENGCGGLDGFVRALDASCRATDNIDAAKAYLAASQTARLCIMLAGILLDIPLLSPVFILIWGLLVDFAAILAMAFHTPTEVTVASHGVVKPILCGAIWGTVLAAIVPLLRLIPTLNVTAIASQALETAVLLSTALCAWLLSRHRAKLHRATLLFLAALLLCAVLLWL